MAEPRSAAEEARDPSTSAERLLELTEKHPQLQSLIVLNPSCPEVARQWILATNPWAKAAYEQSATDAAAEPSPGSATSSEPAPDPASASASADPDAVSAWGDYSEEALWGGAPSSGTGAAGEPAPAAADAPSAPGSPSVRVSEDAGVVPLGPVAAAGASAAAITSPHGVPPVPAAPRPGDAPTSGAYAVGPGSHPAAASTAALPPVPDDPPPSRRRLWYACGGCLLLALLLVVVGVFAGRAWLASNDDQYERDSSTTAQETPADEASPTTEETPAEDPVSPAPDGAVEMDALSSPTGNITCTLEEDSVGCSVVERDFSEAGLDDCDDGPYSIRVAEAEAALACGSSFLTDTGATLEYDQSAVHGDMACTSRFDGMTCWNTITGHGFMVNRATYETF